MRKLLVHGGVVLALIASSLIAGSPASAGNILDDPPTDQIVIDLVAMAGSGCRPGTADVAVSPDNTAFTAIYSEYLAQAGPGIASTEGRKNCQLNVLVHVPQGFTFAITKVDYRGYGLLQSGAVASQRANYYFQGMTQSTFTTHPVTRRSTTTGSPATRSRSPPWSGTLRRAAQPQHQHRTAGGEGHLHLDGGQLPDHGLHRRQHLHHVPLRMAAVPLDRPGTTVARIAGRPAALATRRHQ